MNNLKSQRGQALVLIALAAVVLFGFAALAIDSSRVYSDKRHAQNAADTSAIAAALAKIRQQDYKAVAISRAADNGYVTDTDSTVTVNLCSESGVECAGLPTGAKRSEYIRVRIISVVPLTLARVVGWTSMTNDVSAVARVKTTLPNPFFMPGNALVAVNPNIDECFKITGNTGLILHDTGIFVNCMGASALFLNGSAAISMDANALVAGCTNNLNFDIGAGEIQCSVDQQPASESTFSGYAKTQNPQACTGQGTYIGTQLTPGFFPGPVNLNPGNTYTFVDGTYCFLSGFTTGNQSTSMVGGSVQWVLSSSTTLGGPADFGSLEVYTGNGVDFKLNNHAVLNAGRFRFFGNGNGNLVLQAGAQLISGDSYMYSAAGEIKIDGQSTTDIHAPVAPDTYAGLLMQYPWSNTNAFEMNGGTNSTWTGLILMPQSEVTYNGGNTFELYGQVIAYDIKINGGADGDIYYESTGGVVQPDDPSIELTQ